MGTNPHQVFVDTSQPCTQTTCAREPFPDCVECRGTGFRAQALAEQLSEPVPEVHQPALPDRLSPALAFDMGRRSVQLEQSQVLDEHLGEQKLVYESATKDELVQACLDRDRVIAQIGRDLYTGKGGTALLREFVRAQLYAAERGSPEAIQKMLQDMFGSQMKADARQLRERGHMLGPTVEQKMDPLQDAIQRAPEGPKGKVE